MSWFVGQIVGVLHEAGAFKIKKIGPTQLILEDEHGFDYTFPESMVVQRQPIQTDAIRPKDNNSVRITSQNQEASSKSQQVPSIDLHAENLQLPQGLATHDILMAQVSAFKRYCNEQFQKRNTKFVVIHGAGEGKLKNEIAFICRGKSGIAMHDAQWSNGAVGASRIELILSRFEKF